jgi:hypothetical protein
VTIFSIELKKAKNLGNKSATLVFIRNFFS